MATITNIAISLGPYFKFASIFSLVEFANGIVADINVTNNDPTSVFLLTNPNDDFASKSPIPNILLGIGSSNIVLTINPNYMNNVATPIFGDPNHYVAGTVTFTFSNESVNTVDFIYDLTDGITTFTANATENIACLHGGSKVTTLDGIRMIKDITPGCKVLTGNGQYAEVKDVVKCWITHPGPEHHAIVFEANSLSKTLPSERLIIDPGHPIKLNLHDGFRPAVKFVAGDGICIKKWTDESIQNPTPSVRWDLVLENGFDNYVANGVIVKSRVSIKNPGYNN
jgi:hypothetical protein